MKVVRRLPEPAARILRGAVATRGGFPKTERAFRMPFAHVSCDLAAQGHVERSGKRGGYVHAQRHCSRGRHP
jgi:hypothetical protein